MELTEKEVKIAKEFSDYLRTKLTENEFWAWVQDWKDPESIIEEAENWDIELQIEQLEIWKQTK